MVGRGILRLGLQDLVRQARTTSVGYEPSAASRGWRRDNPAAARKRVAERAASHAVPGGSEAGGLLCRAHSSRARRHTAISGRLSGDGEYPSQAADRGQSSAEACSGPEAASCRDKDGRRRGLGIDALSGRPPRPGHRCARHRRHGRFVRTRYGRRQPGRAPVPCRLRRVAVRLSREPGVAELDALLHAGRHRQVRLAGGVSTPSAAQPAPRTSRSSATASVRSAC